MQANLQTAVLHARHEPFPPQTLGGPGEVAVVSLGLRPWLLTSTKKCSIFSSTAFVRCTLIEYLPRDEGREART